MERSTDDTPIFSETGRPRVLASTGVAMTSITTCAAASALDSSAIAWERGRTRVDIASQCGPCANWQSSYLAPTSLRKIVAIDQPWQICWSGCRPSPLVLFSVTVSWFPGGSYLESN